jgi:hypothetical protein
MTVNVTRGAEAWLAAGFDERPDATVVVSRRSNLRTISEASFRRRA